MIWISKNQDSLFLEEIHALNFSQKIESPPPVAERGVHERVKRVIFSNPSPQKVFWREGLEKVHKKPHHDSKNGLYFTIS
jgi:hypothetical protein